MSVQGIINSNKDKIKDLPLDAQCHKFGICTNLCKYRSTCPIQRTKLLLHCLIINDEDKTYYPIEYTNDIISIPKDVRIESTIVESCANNKCSNTVFYSSIFKDIHMNMALNQGKRFLIYCCMDCKKEYEFELINEGYKCVKGLTGSKRNSIDI